MNESGTVFLVPDVQPVQTVRRHHLVRTSAVTGPASVTAVRHSDQLSSLHNAVRWLPRVLAVPSRRLRSARRYPQSALLQRRQLNLVRCQTSRRFKALRALPEATHHVLGAPTTALSDYEVWDAQDSNSCRHGVLLRDVRSEDVADWGSQIAVIWKSAVFRKHYKDFLRYATKTFGHRLTKISDVRS